MRNPSDPHYYYYYYYYHHLDTIRYTRPPPPPPSPGRAHRHGAHTILLYYFVYIITNNPSVPQQIDPPPTRPIRGGESHSRSVYGIIKILRTIRIDALRANKTVECGSAGRRGADTAEDYEYAWMRKQNCCKLASLARVPTTAVKPLNAGHSRLLELCTPCTLDGFVG